MAFLRKAGNVLRQSAAKHMNSELTVSSPSIYHAIRCMSSSKLFIGGLSYSTDDQSLREAFGNYGEVVEARVITDRESGRSRGFGFITFNSTEAASSAIQALDGQDLHGRRVRVNYATDRTSGGGFGGGGYGSGAGGYGSGGGGYGSGGGGYGSGGGGYGSGGSGYGGGYSDGGSYGGGGGNYGSQGGGDYGSQGGGGYGSQGGGGYGSQGSGGYGSQGSGGYGSQGSGGYGSGNNFDNGSSSSGNFGVAPGGGFGNVDQFSNTGSAAAGSDAAGGFNHTEPMNGNYRDEDDEPDSFAKRA